VGLAHPLWAVRAPLELKAAILYNLSSLGRQNTGGARDPLETPFRTINQIPATWFGCRGPLALSSQTQRRCGKTNQTSWEKACANFVIGWRILKLVTGDRRLEFCWYPYNFIHHALLHQRGQSRLEVGLNCDILFQPGITSSLLM
jgi:hypothetical protein